MSLHETPMIRAYCVHHLGRIEAVLEKLLKIGGLSGLFSDMPQFSKNVAVTCRDLNDEARELQLNEALLIYARGKKRRWPEWLAKWLPNAPIEEMFVEMALVLGIVWFGIALGFAICLIWFR